MSIVLKNSSRIVLVSLLIALLLVGGCAKDSDKNIDTSKKVIEKYFDQIGVYKENGEKVHDYLMLYYNDKNIDEAKKIEEVHKYMEDLRGLIPESSIEERLKVQDLFSQDYEKYGVASYKMTNWNASKSTEKEGAIDTKFNIEFLDSDGKSLGNHDYSVRFIFDGDKVTGMYGDMFPVIEVK